MRPQELVIVAARLSGFSVLDLLEHSRRHPLLAWRQATMTAIRDECDWSYPAIGRLFDGRDHATVIHAVQRCAADAERQHMVDQIKGAVGNPRAHLRVIDGGRGAA